MDSAKHTVYVVQRHPEYVLSIRLRSFVEESDGYLDENQSQSRRIGRAQDADPAPEMRDYRHRERSIKRPDQWEKVMNIVCTGRERQRNEWWET